MWKQVPCLEVMCQLTSNLLRHVTALAVGRLQCTHDGVKPGLQSCSPTKHPPWRHQFSTRQAHKAKAAQGCLIRLLYDKLSPDQVHGKAGAQFKLTLLFHSKVCRKTIRLPITAVGKNQDHMKWDWPRNAKNLSIFTTP